MVTGGLAARAAKLAAAGGEAGDALRVAEGEAACFAALAEQVRWSLIDQHKCITFGGNIDRGHIIV